jgi:hypothetical protein
LASVPGSGFGPVVAEMLRRVADSGEWAAWKRQVAHTGWCRRPVRLRGQAHAVDTATGEIRATFCSEGAPDATLLVACGDRREKVCPPCAATYRADLWHVVAAGLRGRDLARLRPGARAGASAGVPASVAGHPAALVTLTAPSFGAVHSVHGGQVCRVRRGRPRCPHGNPLWCASAHDDDDPRVGSPLCCDCYDYTGHVLWHAMLPGLWRRTLAYIYRALARAASAALGRRVATATVRRLVRVSYVKVAEWQRRAVAHLHVVVRLDGVVPDDPAAVVAPPAWAEGRILERCVRWAASRASVRLPVVEHRARAARTARWGTQLDVSAIGHPERTAAYLAKYATKTAGDTVPGLPAQRVGFGDLAGLRRRGLSAHAGLLVGTCLRLDRVPACAGLRLGEHAHTLGYPGHFATKSRHYSTTMTALRAVRRAWRAAQRSGPDGEADVWAERPGLVVVGDWRLVGVGYRTWGDMELAETLAREHEAARAAVGDGVAGSHEYRDPDQGWKGVDHAA